MNKVDYSFTETYPIRTHEIDQHKQLTVPSLILLMQEASMQNAMKLKISVWDLEENHSSWVLLRKKLEIYRLPKLGEKVRILTYPAGIEKVFAYRDFKAYDESNQLIASASSCWALMDIKTRKMIRIPSGIFDFGKAVNQDYLERPIAKLPQMAQIDLKNDYTVNWYNLDWNGHVNNVFLLRGMVETVPQHFLQSGKLSLLNIHFRSESLWKDQLEFRCGSLSDKSLAHTVIRKNDGKLIASGWSVWK